MFFQNEVHRSNYKKIIKQKSILEKKIGFYLMINW